MATLGRTNNGSSQNTSRRAYIATTTFYQDFFSYRTYLDADRVTQGVLDLVTSDPTQAPKNRILRETGKKLFPGGVNPDVDTLLVGVYDTVTFLNGYIDPNSPVFAVYSTDFANFLPDGNDRGVQDLPDRGPPVLTNGLVEALSSITTTGGNLMAPAGSAVVANQLRATNVSTVIINSAGTYVIDPQYASHYNIYNAATQGAQFTINVPSSNAIGTTLNTYFYNSNANTVEQICTNQHR